MPVLVSFWWRQFQVMALSLASASVSMAEPSGTPRPTSLGAFADAEGCMWQRAEIDGDIVWAAIIGAEDQQLCDAAAAKRTAVTEMAVPADNRPPRNRIPKFPAPGLYIQVAAFRDAENSDRTIAELQALDLEVLRQEFPRKSGALRLIYAGPFAQPSEAEAARQEVRRAGFRDAFIWDAR